MQRPKAVVIPAGTLGLGFPVVNFVWVDETGDIVRNATYEECKHVRDYVNGETMTLHPSMFPDWHTT